MAKNQAIGHGRPAGIFVTELLMSTYIVIGSPTSGVWEREPDECSHLVLHDDVQVETGRSGPVLGVKP